MKTWIRFTATVFVPVWMAWVASAIHAETAAKPGDSYPEFTNDGAWCWFQDPRAVYAEGKHKRTYAQWMTRDGRLVAGSYDHDSGAVQTFILKEDWGVDDHNAGSFLVLEDNRLMAFYAQHNKKAILCRTTSEPENILKWEKEITISDSDRITYSHPAYLKAEKRYYVFWRGPSWKPTFSTSNNGVDWTEPQVLLQDSGREANTIRPYFKAVSDGISTIHIAFTDGHPRPEPQNSVYYLKYEKGAFYRADGAKAADIAQLPVSHKNSDLVYDAKRTNVRSWVWDIALDDQGYPVIAYVRFPQETDHRYHYARWNGKQWFDTELTAAGRWFPQTPPGQEERERYYSAGLCLDHFNPSRLYLARPVNGVFEIEKWTTPDKGQTWKVVPITENSKTLNARPVAPYGYTGTEDHVLWMQGEYVFYQNFHTGIRIKAPSVKQE